MRSSGRSVPNALMTSIFSATGIGSTLRAATSSESILSNFSIRRL